MYRPMHELPRKGLGKYKKSHILLVSLLALVIFGVGATAAFMMDSTAAIENVFEPTAVRVAVEETFENNVKSNVSVKNAGTEATGEVPAYIRAKIVVTWKDNSGNVYGQAPTQKDYEMTLNTGKWTYADGYYYYQGIVDAGDTTAVLITECKESADSSRPEGYHLSVEILAQGIQAEGMGVSSAQAAFAKAGGGA